MRWVDEFKEFVLRGNMVDMAVGIIIGGAFGKVVNSLVNDVIMPPIGMLLGGVDFSDLAVQLKAARGDQPAVLIQYGAFINQLLDLMIIAGAIFIVIKVMNRIRRSKPKDPDTKKCPECQMDIPVAAKKCGHCTSAL